MSGKMRHYGRTVNGPLAASGQVDGAAILPHMKETAYDRIIQVIEELGLTPRDVSLQVTEGRNPDLIRNMKRGRARYPKEPELGRLAQILRRPVEWITGDSDIYYMSIDEAEQVSGNSTRRQAISGHALYKGSAPGAMAEVADVAGMGQGQTGEIVSLQSRGIESGHPVVGEWVFPVEVSRYWIGIDPRRALLMAVKGDSMEPTLRGNDRVIVDLTDRMPSEPAIYVIDEGHGPMVKRVRVLHDQKPVQLLIQSDNPLGGTWQRALDDVQIIGRVRGRVTVF